MSLFDYFSKDANKRAKFMFGAIAPIYAKVDPHLVSGYQKTIEILKNEIKIKGQSVLDVGTGTGAWAMKFVQSNAAKVHGVDLSPKMHKISKEKHPEIIFSIGDVEDLKDFSDNSFDIVTASFVVHGVKADRREKMLSEMKRVSKKYVILHDFVGKTPTFIRFLEFMEKSDYKNFKKEICNELQAKFTTTKKIESDLGSGLYIATLYSKLN
jgi:ubiquinone/menaquinone biosynthesis C-methylase UbiE